MCQMHTLHEQSNRTETKKSINLNVQTLPPSQRSQGLMRSEVPPIASHQANLAEPVHSGAASARRCTTSRSVNLQDLLSSQTLPDGRRAQRSVAFLYQGPSLGQVFHAKSGWIVQQLPTSKRTMLKKILACYIGYEEGSIEDSALYKFPLRPLTRIGE